MRAFLRRGVLAALVLATPVLVALAVAMSAPSAECGELAVRGKFLFLKNWQVQTPSEKQGDGLGPYFNERSCAGCHRLGGFGGAGPNANNVQLIALLPKEDEVPVTRSALLRPRPPAPTVLVLHRESTVPNYPLLRLQRLAWANPKHPEVVDFLPRPAIASHEVFCLDGREHSPAFPASYEERNTPALFGAGLIDMVSLDELLKVAAAQPPAMRGRPAMLAPDVVGRFGWKGQNATLLDFCENACAVELGLETPARHQTPAPFERREPGKPFQGYLGPIVPDISAMEVTELTAFTASLPAPRQVIRDATHQFEVRDGERLFGQLKCIVCHQRDLGEAKGVYGDLLLHNVGTTGSVYYNSAPTPGPDIVSGERIVPVAAGEFRTPPLWGVGDSGPYMHDGSAPNLHQAILAHEGQAVTSRSAYIQLTSDEQDRVLTFLESLRAPLVR